MHRDAERFISLATAPLAANAELKLSAEAELRKAIARTASLQTRRERGADAESRPAPAIGVPFASGSGDPRSLQQAADSLERADCHPHRGRWQMVLVIVTLLVSLPLLGLTVWQLKPLMMMQNFPFMDRDAAPRSFPRITAKQNLLLFGASGVSDEAERWKPLWESEPEHPAYLAAYATGYFKEHQSLSPEILDAAERVDPDNGFFITLAAAGHAQGAVTHERQAGRPKTNPPAPVWIINDEKRLREALTAIHRAAAKPRYDGYFRELAGARISALPSRTDLASGITAFHYVNFFPSSSSAELRKLSDILAAGAQQAAADNDPQRFHAIVADWEILSKRIAENVNTYFEGLVTKLLVMGPLENFRDAARKLGFEAEARHFDNLREVFNKEGREKAVRILSPNPEMIERRASILFGMGGHLIGRQVKAAPILTEADLRPGRYADHALLERISSWLAWAVLGTASALAVLSRFIRSPLARKLSERMVHLIRPADWVYVVLGGIVFPVLWYFLITRLSPWGAREWSARLSMFASPGGQFGCLALSLLILPAVIASGRLAKRGAALGLQPRFRWLGWLAALAALAALAGVPAYGAMMFPGNVGMQKAAFGLAGFAGLWLLTGLAMNCFSGTSQALRRATLARIVWPVWVIGMLAFVGLVPYFHAEEIRWLRQDRLMEISADAPGWSRHEYEVTRILRTELLETIAEAGPVPGTGR